MKTISDNFKDFTVLLYNVLIFLMNVNLEKRDFPDVKSYLSIQLFIKDIYEYRKIHDPHFSYSMWSKEIGIKNRSYLRLIITGQRSVSEDITELFQNHLQLKGKDREYFQYLVLYSQSKKQEQKNLYGRKMIQLLKKSSGKAVIEHYEIFLANPQLPKIRTLLSYEKFDGTLSAVSKALEISEEEAQKSFNALVSLGLAHQESHSNTLSWKATDPVVKINDHPGDGVLKKFHAQSLNEAIQAQQLDPSERKFQSLMLAMNKIEYLQFLESFQNFIEDQLSIHDKKNINDRRLYQMNFNLIPISKKIHNN